MLSKRFRRGYQDLKSSFFCQNAALSTDNNQVPCIDPANKTGIGDLDSNPGPKLTCRYGKSHSQGLLLPNHTTSHSKFNFISEPQENLRLPNKFSIMTTNIV